MTPVQTIESATRFAVQEAQYEFPYHFLAHLRADGTLLRGRSLRWGFEYLCYQYHIAETVRSWSPRSVLEVGCGDGRFIGMLGDTVSRRVGVDLAPRAIAFARAFHPDVDFECRDAASMSECFDVVAAIEVLEHVPDEAVTPFLQTMARRLATGGRMLICVPTDLRKVHRKHYRHYNLPLLEQQLSAAVPELQLDTVEYLYRDSRLLNLYAALTCNRYLHLDVAALNRLIWRRVWKHRVVGAAEGCHLFVVASRRASA